MTGGRWHDCVAASCPWDDCASPGTGTNRRKLLRVSVGDATRAQQLDRTAMRVLVGGSAVARAEVLRRAHSGVVSLPCCPNRLVHRAAGPARKVSKTTSADGFEGMKT